MPDARAVTRSNGRLRISETSSGCMPLERSFLAADSSKESFFLLSSSISFLTSSRAYFIMASMHALRFSSSS